MECSPFAKFLQILINTHKPVSVLFAFEPIGDAMTDISPMVEFLSAAQLQMAT